MTDVGRIAETLSGSQRQAVLVAYPLSGPSGDYIVTDDEDDPLPPELAHPVSGRLSALGLAVREHLRRDRP